MICVICTGPAFSDCSPFGCQQRSLDVVSSARVREVSWIRLNKIVFHSPVVASATSDSMMSTKCSDGQEQAEDNSVRAGCVLGLSCVLVREG